MTYRLIALDLDGTTVMDGQPPTARVRRAVAAAQAQGVHVIFATGRNYASARKFAAHFGVAGPLVCFQGALVRSADAPAPLLVETLPAEPLAEALALTDEAGLELTLYGEDRIYLTHTSYPQQFYDLWFDLPMVHVLSFDEALAQIAARGGRPFKGLFIAAPDELDRLTPQLRARFAGRLGVVRSHPMFLELLAPRASKGNAVAFLAQRFGIPQSEVIAVGDNGNDVSMIQWAGLGVAMGNATAEVLAAADWIAPSVDADGVAVVIERFVLNNGHV